MKRWQNSIGTILLLCLLASWLPGQSDSELPEDGSYILSYLPYAAPVSKLSSGNAQEVLQEIRQPSFTSIRLKGEVLDWELTDTLDQQSFYIQYRLELEDLPEEIIIKKIAKRINPMIIGIFDAQRKLHALGTLGVFRRVHQIERSVKKCYTKSLIADQYEAITEQVLLKEATTRYETIPAAYDMVTETVLTKEASTKIELTPPQFDTLQGEGGLRPAYYTYQILPAEYESVTEQVQVNAAATRMERIPAEYETVTEDIETRPASNKWVKKKTDRNCLSADPNDCLVWCLEETPAAYRTVTKKVRKGCPDGYSDQGEDCLREIEIPAEYASRTVLKLIRPARVDSTLVPAEFYPNLKITLNQPAQKRIIQIPATYETVSKRVLTATAEVRAIEIPAEYTTITRNKLIRKGGFTEWHPVICPEDHTPALIQQLQFALKEKGYTLNSTNGEFDTTTKAALSAFQKANGLPVGGLNHDSVWALGLEVE